MKAKILLIGSILSISATLLVSKSAHAEFVNNDDYWRDNNNRCYTERRIVRYDHDGYPVYREKRNCNRYSNRRAVVNRIYHNTWWSDRWNRDYDYYRDRDRDYDQHRNDRGGFQIRLRF
jgi:hypothetical protein